MYLTLNIVTFSKVTAGLPSVTKLFCDLKIVVFGGYALLRHKKWGVMSEKVGKKTQKQRKTIKSANFHLIMSDSLQDTIFKIS